MKPTADGHKYPKVSMKDLKIGWEKMTIDSYYAGYHKIINADLNNLSEKYSPRTYYELTFKRKVTKKDIMKQKINLMPGFRFNWYYSGLEVVPEAIDSYLTDTKTKAFVRFDLIYFKLNSNILLKFHII